MNLFETAKSVPLPDVAERYGAEKVKRLNANASECICPFHPDTNPSMRLNTGGRYDGTFYCFTCHAKGTSIDLAMKLLNLDARQASERIVNDFCGGHYDIELPAEQAKLKKRKEAIEQTTERARIFKSIWNAHYKMMRDHQLDENQRLDELEANGHEMTEEESLEYIKNSASWQTEMKSDEAVVHMIEHLEEEKDYSYLAKYLNALMKDTELVYNGLLIMDEESGSNYVRGISYGK